MSVPWTIVTPPTTPEPITLAEVQTVCRTDPDTTAENTYLSTLITTARKLVEKHTHRVLAPQAWSTLCSYWPKNRYLTLPTAPVTAITGATYTTKEGTQTLAADQYQLIAYETRLPLFQLADDAIWPTSALVYPGFKVTFACGYTTVPSELLEAMRALIVYWYENREAAIASTQYKAEVSELPLRYRDLITPYTLRIL